MKTILAFLTLALSTHAANWPNWRGGTDGSGITKETALPVKWSATENVAWKVALPERGNSTPVVWGGKIFLTQALEKSKERTLMCLTAADGKVLWTRAVPYDKPEESHPTNPYCSASPTTDGERVVVCHGSAGIFAYDLEGKELWRRDLGRQAHEWGNGSSPVLHGGRVFVYFGPGKGARMLALDAKTGKDVWSVAEKDCDPTGRVDGFRGNEPGIICSYATPIVIASGKREELVMLYPEVIRAHDLATGAELWNCDGINPLIYSSPIHGEGVVVGMGGYFGNTIAVPAGGTGDMTPKRLWQTVRTKNRLGSGVIHEGHVYIHATEGMMECVELKSGRTIYTERLKAAGAKGDSWSSMTLSGDRIYLLNQSGDCHVVRASPKFELLATNHIGNELTNSSVAVCEGRLLIRTHAHLWCIGGK